MNLDYQQQGLQYNLFFFNDTATTEIYTLSLHDALPISLLPQIRVTNRSPPAFLVHTHDDRSSSVGAVLIYEIGRAHV